jgi:protein dithiol oxidoreductase (disulfide-forming)
MNRASQTAFVLAFAVFAGALSLNACAQGKPAAALEKWTPGTNYQRLDEQKTTYAPRGKIEVAEFFWYGCGHCYALDPALETWRTGKAPYVEFVRVPVIWSPQHRQHAKLYYTIQALGKPELHAQVFEAIHKQGKPIAGASDELARSLALDFVKEHGVTEAEFNKAYDSMPVAASLDRADDLTQRYQIASVPLLFVNGKYQTSVSMAGSPEKLLSLIDDLAASEQNR